MSGQQPYQKHIEQAIQNVLSKVKNPGRAEEGQSAPAAVRPAAVRPAPRREALKTGSLSRPLPETQPPAPETALPTSPLEPAVRERPSAKILDEPEGENLYAAYAAPTEAPTEEAAVAEPVYYEAEDLYTPLLEEDISPEPEEPPLQEDSYSPPYNLFEEFVETELNILLSRYLDLCRCSQCRSDIVALALHQLPAYYVTGTRGTLTAKSVIWTRYMQQIMDAVTKAIHVVYKRPRPNCRRIKQVLWIKPEIEDVAASADGLGDSSLPAPAPPQGEFFGAIHQDDVEIKFSDEISELIQTLEAAPVADRAELLPVFSPIVQKAYQQHHDEASAPKPDELQLLDIDNWES